MFGEHLNRVRRLMEIKRYSNKLMHKQRSVAEHSWFVTKVAHGLAFWEKNKFHNEVDIDHVQFLATNHDMVESYTGDFLSTTKNSSINLRNALEEEEHRTYRDDILWTIPKSWGESYLQVHSEMTKLDTIESQIVKAADLIDRVYEYMDEINLGNKNGVLSMLKSDLEKLSNTSLMCVKYFLKYSINDIGAQEYFSKEAKLKLKEMNFEAYF